MKYIILCLIIILIVYLINRFLIKNKEGSISTTLIVSGIGLITGETTSGTDHVLVVIGQLFGIDVDTGTNYIMIISGFMLIILGIVVRVVLKDRIFVLNMFGLFLQNEISDKKNIKDLKLVDFKVKEIIIDFVDIFKSQNKMTEKNNNLIVEKIKKQCNIFQERSREFKSCYTGMGPIPYTILAGTYLSNSKVERYFEYKASEGTYYELKKNNKYPKIKVCFPEDKDLIAKDVVVAISITKRINESDIEQFENMDVIRIEIEDPQDNIIKSKKQLNEYKMIIIDCLEKIKNEYIKIKNIHLLASIPSCMSIEIGKMISARNNRIPRVISYHYSYGDIPKYIFGIVVTDHEKGKLIK